jgi:hypothetical protein
LVRWGRPPGGESAVLAGAVVLGTMATDQLLPDTDLDGVIDHGDLDLPAFRGLVRQPGPTLFPNVERHLRGNGDD